jgi:hypothetical protein
VNEASRTEYDTDYGRRWAEQKKHRVAHNVSCFLGALRFARAWNKTKTAGFETDSNPGPSNLRSWGTVQRCWTSAQSKMQGDLSVEILCSVHRKANSITCAVRTPVGSQQLLCRAAVPSLITQVSTKNCARWENDVTDWYTKLSLHLEHNDGVVLQTKQVKQLFLQHYLVSLHQNRITAQEVPKQRERTKRKEVLTICNIHAQIKLLYNYSNTITRHKIFLPCWNKQICPKSFVL